MLPSAAKLGVPIIMMHMRGTPDNMKDLAQYPNEQTKVIDCIANELNENLNRADSLIPRWLQVCLIHMTYY